MFSCEFREINQNDIFADHLWAIVSEIKSLFRTVVLKFLWIGHYVSIEIIFSLFCINLSFWGNYLVHFNPIFHFYTPWKRQKIKGFLMFLRGIEMEDWR